jgi:hypothetical protein
MSEKNGERRKAASRGNSMCGHDAGFDGNLITQHGQRRQAAGDSGLCHEVARLSKHIKHLAPNRGATQVSSGVKTQHGCQSVVEPH